MVASAGRDVSRTPGRGGVTAPATDPSPTVRRHLTRSELAGLLDQHGLRPSRALGQHFLADPNTARRIVRLADVGSGDRVVEVGAGLGSLTLALAATGAAVTAVEMDRHLVPVLRTIVEPAGVRVAQGDALSLDWDRLLGQEPGWVLVANLPYNVATPVVVRFLEEVPAVSRMLVMVQTEVAERLAAVPGSRVYGAVSVKVAYWGLASVMGRVSPTVFLPQPGVGSSLVAIRRRPVPAIAPGVVGYHRLMQVVAAGFGTRRKMLRRSLAGVVSDEAFVAAGVSPSARAEELDVQAWGRLAAGPQPAARPPATR